MTGSMRQRGSDSWELRLYVGLDPDTGEERWATRTVHGSQRHGRQQLHLLADEVLATRTHAGTFGHLLERWFEVASPRWSASTVRETRSLMRCHLVPLLGHVPVAKLTTEDIDDLDQSRVERLIAASRTDRHPTTIGRTGQCPPTAGDRGTAARSGDRLG